MLYAIRLSLSNTELYVCTTCYHWFSLPPEHSYQRYFAQRSRGVSAAEFNWLGEWMGMNVFSIRQGQSIYHFD